MQQKAYENYPFRIACISNLVALAIYAIGAIIVFQIGWIWGVLYLLFIILLEYKLLREGCRHCYYYNKYCAFGRGKLCALFFRKGNPQKFTQRKFTRKDMIPDVLVSIIPIVIGIILLILHFNRRILIGIIALLALMTKGNSCIRWQLACKHCKQRQLGCPAAKLFMKKRK